MSSRFFAVIPAAGFSRRMGADKLLEEIDGVPLFRRVLQTWQAASLEAIVVVTRPSNPDLIHLCQQEACDLVVADHDPADMKATTMIGLAYLEEHFAPHSEDAWLLAPADLPGLDVPSIEAVKQAYLQQKDAAATSQAVVATVSGKKAHPVLFPWSLRWQIDQLHENEGINQLLKQYSFQRVELKRQLLLEDVDTPDDLRRWREINSRHG